MGTSIPVGALLLLRPHHIITRDIVRPSMSQKDSEYDEHEIVLRREAALKRMLSTPPKPHAESAKPRKAKRAKARRPSTGKEST